MNEASEICTEIQAHLPLFVGGDLEPGVLELVRSHVSTCGSCSELHAGAERARDALLGLTVGGLSEDPDLWPELRRRLAGEGLFAPAAATTEGPPGPVSPRALRWVGGVAAAAALVVALVPFGIFGGGRADPASPVAQDRPGAPALGAVSSDPGEAFAGRVIPPAPIDVIPVGTHGLLRKARPGEERLSEGALPLRFRIQPERRIPIHVGENVMAGSGIR